MNLVIGSLPAGGHGSPEGAVVHEVGAREEEEGGEDRGVIPYHGGRMMEEAVGVGE
jgi:hypothetical protein